MKTGTNYLRRIKLLLATAALAVPLAGSAQIWPWWYIPERFGVINITPNNLSGESAQNSEPSLGVGTGSKYGKMVAHAFPEDYYYTSSSSAISAT